ncbi:hypothetical protein MHU86_18686 [Fragilaria crotonensis]|nr:hypothetical protein MHU86_18686 [Fragilaria crotonensis]
MKDTSGSCDIILDCQGKLLDENGLNQEVLRTTLRGSAILSKRCKWLEREQHVRAESDDGDDGIAPLPYPAEAHDNSRIEGATEIENDDDEEANYFSSTSRSGSPLLASSYGSDLLWVTIPNHPPEAVKLLLEYCYTNSVIPLGQEAFEVAWKPPDKDGGTTPSSLRPLSRQWPDKNKRKNPTISLATALAGIALAEEANLPRMSLMCEVAACNLVESANVVEALSMCTRQNELTANPLKRLRKASMALVLRRRDVDHLTATLSFKRALREPERSAVLVPSLLIGAMEAVVAQQTRLDTALQLESISRRAKERFEALDRDDILLREMERRKHRADFDKRHNPPYMHDHDIDLPNYSLVKWDGASQARKR